MSTIKELTDQSCNTLQWKVNTPGLLSEVLLNPTCGILKIPIAIFAEILYEVGQRASELNDDKLNALMCRLAIYSISDPNCPEYSRLQVEEIILKGR